METRADKNTKYEIRPDQTTEHDKPRANRRPQRAGKPATGTERAPKRLAGDPEGTKRNPKEPTVANSGSM